MKGCPVCLNGTSHLPAVWLGSWWTPVFFRGWTADMCDAGSGQTRTSLQLNPQSTGQTRSQMSSQTLGNPGHFWMRRGSQRSTVSNRTQHLKEKESTHSDRVDTVDLPQLTDGPLGSPDERRGAFELLHLREEHLRWFLIGHCNEREHRFEFGSNVYHF